MPTKVQSLVLRAPGIHGLNLEGEQIQAQPTFARIANNVAFDSAGRLGNRKGFSSTSSKYNVTLGANPITPAAATAADDDGIAVAARPVTTFTLVSESLPPTAPRYISATTASVTVATSAVNTSTDVITVSSHGLATTNSVTYHNGGGTALAGLTHESTYYVVKVDANSFKLASSYDNAVNGTTIDLTGTGNNSQYFTDGDKTITITGTNVSDAAITETLTLPTTAGTVNGTALFKTVTKVEISGYPVANVKVGVQASTVVTVAQTAHGRAVGDTVTLANATATSGIDAVVLNESHVLTTVPDANSYTIVVLDSSTGTSAGGGSSVVASFVGLVGYPDIEQLFQYNASGGNKLIATATVASTRKIYKLDSPYSSFDDVTGSTNPSGNDWQFVNFDDKVIGARASNGMIVYTGSSTFANISAAHGTVPTGNIVHSAFGRLWVQKSHTGTGQNVIAYSALLDETIWDSSHGAGEIDLMSNKGAVHTGFDELTAISSFDGFLVAFLRNSIVIFDSPEDPGSLVIEQIIQGIGCIARDSVQQVGNDIYFLSATGVRSLKQVVFTTQRVEMGEVSIVVRKELIDDMNTPTGNLSKIRSQYNPEERQYWLKAPGGDIWVFHNDNIEQDQKLTRITKYINTGWYSFVYFEGDTFLGFEGCIGKYSGYSDADTTTSPPSAKSYTCRWASTYADFDSSKIKILKNIGTTVFGASNQKISLDWDLDIGESSGSAQLLVPSAGTLSEWNSSEWNVGEWAGSVSLSKLRTAASRTGRVVSIGVSFASSGNAISLEQLSLFVKLGREDK
jgi:hypothetical protein